MYCTCIYIGEKNNYSMYLKIQIILLSRIYNEQNKRPIIIVCRFLLADIVQVAIM